ncbi:hypothetical protein AB5J52_48420 (plasmid) [Streptomyces sp. R39]|uniref:HEAT repeat domain-containing protein n=1 Tax=Streptomyces sp. R39 TaxID=3238631 RepID=A0AB39R8E4_9ACTN
MPGVFGSDFRWWQVRRITPGRRHAVAAALIHGMPTEARGAYELLAPSLRDQIRAEFPLQLLRIAASSASSPIRPESAEPVIAAICANLGLGQTPYFSLHVRTARAMGSSLFVAYLMAHETSDPCHTVRALLSLGPEHTPDAVRFLAVQARAFPRSVLLWCQAAQMLRPFRDACADVVRLLREVAAAADEAEDLLELCRTLIEFGADDAAAKHLMELAQDTATDLTHRCAAVRILSDSEGPEERADLAHAVMAELSDGASCVERLALAQTLQRVDPRGRHAAAALVFSALEDPSLPFDSRRQALALLAGMGPDVRRRMAAGLEQIYAASGSSDAVRLTGLRIVSVWGPDLHRAAQGIWERMTRNRKGVKRLTMAAELHKLGWLSEVRSARFLNRIARSEDEEPYIRAAAAQILLRRDPGQRRVSGEILHGLVHAQQVTSLLALQAARDLASAGGLLEARRVLSTLIRNTEAVDSHRYKAATILLMIDLACGPDTLAVLRGMTTDRSLSEHTRAWARYAVDCAENGLRTLDTPPPDSWQRS